MHAYNDKRIELKTNNLNEKIDAATAKVATASLGSPLPMSAIQEEPEKEIVQKQKIVSLEQVFSDVESSHASSTVSS